MEHTDTPVEFFSPEILKKLNDAKASGSIDDILHVVKEILVSSGLSAVACLALQAWAATLPYSLGVLLLQGIQAWLVTFTAAWPLHLGTLLTGGVTGWWESI